MKVLITNRFQKKYLEKNKKYFSIDEFVEVLKEKNHNFISLHYPFSKFKNKINLVSFRGVIFIHKENTIVPVFIYLKKDKSFGENINWFKDKNFIKSEFVKNMEDIENGNFSTY